MNIKKILLILFTVWLMGCSPLASVNEGALSYKNGKCRIFFPPNNEEIETYAKQLCESGEERIFDFVTEDFGEFRIVHYNDGHYFYTEKDYADIVLKVSDHEETLRDMLRYQMKIDDIDAAYMSSFLMDTDNLDYKQIPVELKDDHLDFYFADYDYHLKVPFSYAQRIVKRNFGYEDKEFITEYYINPNRPMVALTYDDGPYAAVDSRLFDILEQYGARATFYIVGNRLTARELESVQRGIELGMEFGSHTEDHSDLSLLDVYTARSLVLEPVDYLYEKTGYEMKTYRPPYGAVNYELDSILNMTSVKWNVDSKDWSNRSAQATYDNIMNRIDNYDVVLMHSLYQSSADATERLVPELMDRGYQLVTVSDMMRILDCDDRYFNGR